MTTEGIGGLGSSEEVREGQLMDPTLERAAAFLMEDSTQNSIPWLESYIRRLVCEAFEHFVMSGPAMVGGSGAVFLMEDSTENTTPWLESYIHRLVCEAFEHFVMLGPAMVGGSVTAFLMEDNTENTTPWLESYIRILVCEAFEHFVMSGPAMVGGREQIQAPDRSIMQLRFQTSMPAHFFVGKKVEGQGGALICVKLIDATTGHVVESGPLSSLILDVVVLAGDFNNEDDDDWTWEHFKSKVELSREGKGPLLEGDLQVPLKGGVGLLEDIKFTDISTCRPSGKFRLGVKVETGFFKGIRVHEAKTDTFEVKHYKKESEEKHVTRALDDDVCTLRGIGNKLQKMLNDNGIFKVKDFLWKRGLDPKGLWEILGKTKNWKTLGDHANESVPRGKSHVLFADNKNYGIVFKNMAELCGLIEGGAYHSAETLSDSQKVLADNLKKKAHAKWTDIVEYDGPPLLEMNPSKRARLSQTDFEGLQAQACRTQEACFEESSEEKKARTNATTTTIDIDDSPLNASPPKNHVEEPKLHDPFVYVTPPDEDFSNVPIEDLFSTSLCPEVFTTPPPVEQQSIVIARSHATIESLMQRLKHLPRTRKVPDKLMGFQHSITQSEYVLSKLDKEILDGFYKYYNSRKTELDAICSMVKSDTLYALLDEDTLLDTNVIYDYFDCIRSSCKDAYLADPSICSWWQMKHKTGDAAAFGPDGSRVWDAKECKTLVYILQAHNHFTLLVGYTDENRWEFYNSLKSDHYHQNICNSFRLWLTQRFEEYGWGEPRVWTNVTKTDIPYQQNGTDCGFFALAYAEHCIHRRPIRFTQADIPYYRRKILIEIFKRSWLLNANRLQLPNLPPF